MGKIADILMTRGQLDDALKIRQEEQLPVFEQLGDVRERAATMAWIAHILWGRGDYDGALRTLREEVHPAYERLGDVRSLVRARSQFAGILLQRAAEGDQEEAGRLLHLAHDEARRMQLPEAQGIEQIIKQAGLQD